MKIEHGAIWVRDLEAMKLYYEDFFEAKAGPKYHNPSKEFSSYFLYFESGGPRLELMHRPDIAGIGGRDTASIGLAHQAFSVGAAEKVCSLTQRIGLAKGMVLQEPRIKGDGYYESVVLDPEGNHLEITV